MRAERGHAERAEALRLMARALRSSAVSIADEPQRLAGQMIGRLMQIDLVAARAVVEGAHGYRRRPWLRPLRSGLADPAGPLIVSLRGQGDEVTAVAITPDGRQVASGSHPRSVKVWDVERGIELRSFDGSRASTEGNIQEVAALAINSGGTRVGTAYEAGGVDVWNPTTGNHLGRAGFSDEDTVWRCALSPDARWAALAFKKHFYFHTGRTDTIEIWDLTQRQKVHELTGDSNALAITPDGHTFVASAPEGLRIWDLTRGTIRYVPGPASASCLAVTPDGRWAVTGGGTLRVWDLHSGNEPRSLPRHRGSVTSVAISADGTRAFSGSSDSTVELWDLERRKSIKRFVAAHAGRVTSVALTPDGHRAVSGGIDKVVRVWDLETSVTRMAPPHNGPVESITITGDGRAAVSVSSDGDERVAWDLETARQMPAVAEKRLVLDERHSDAAAETIRALEQDRVHADNYQVTAIAVSEDQTRGICVVHASHTASAMHRWFDDTSTLRVWHLGDEPVGHVLAIDNRAVIGLHNLAFGNVDVAITRDGRCAVTAADDHTVTLWDVDARVPVADFVADSPMCACAISPDGHTIVAGDDGGQVHILRLVTPSAAHDYLPPEPEAAGTVEFYPEGLLHKFGFGDGDMLAEHVAMHDLNVDFQDLLLAVVEQLVIPQLDQQIETETIYATMHNPIRATTIDGEEADSSSVITPQIVEVPLTDIIRIAHSLPPLDEAF